MADLSRRQFIGKGSIGVAAGVAALTLGPQGAIAEAATGAQRNAPVDRSEATANEPIVAYVKQGARGEVRLMVGSQEIVHRDADLARRIIRASKTVRTPASRKEPTYVIAPRGAGHLERPRRRQHRSLRVREPRQPEWVTILANFIPLEFRRPAAPTSSSSATTSPTTSTCRTTAPGHDITYRFRFRTTCRTRRRSCTTRARSIPQQPQLEPAAVLLGHEDPAAATRTCWRRAWRAPRSTSARGRPPTTTSLATAAIHTLNSGEVVFAGQRNEGFFVDLGSIFDLGTFGRSRTCT